MGLGFLQDFGPSTVAGITEYDSYSDLPGGLDNGALGSVDGLVYQLHKVNTIIVWIPYALLSNATHQTSYDVTTASTLAELEAGPWTATAGVTKTSGGTLTLTGGSTVNFTYANPGSPWLVVWKNIRRTSGTSTLAPWLISFEDNKRIDWAANFDPADPVWRRINSSGSVIGDDATADSTNTVFQVYDNAGSSYLWTPGSEVVRHVPGPVDPTETYEAQSGSGARIIAARSGTATVEVDEVVIFKLAT